MRYRFLAIMAFVGFFASLACHVMALLGIEPPGRQAVMLFLSIGIFPLWFMLIISANRTKPPSAGRANLDHLLSAVPKWIRLACGLVAAYGIANFIYFMYRTSQYPKHHVPFLVELRGISGHWMLFYGMSAVGSLGLDRFIEKQKTQAR